MWPTTGAYPQAPRPDRHLRERRQHKKDRWQSMSAVCEACHIRPVTNCRRDPTPCDPNCGAAHRLGEPEKSSVRRCRLRAGRHPRCGGLNGADRHNGTAGRCNRQEVARGLRRKESVCATALLPAGRPRCRDEWTLRGRGLRGGSRLYVSPGCVEKDEVSTTPGTRQH